MLGLRKLVLTNQKNIHEIIKILGDVVETQKRIMDTQKKIVETQRLTAEGFAKKLGLPISR